MERKLTVVLAIIGLAITGYLTYVHFTGVDAKCLAGNQDDCNNVLTSSYSVFMGIPVALLGMFAYAGILYVLWRYNKDNNKVAKYLTFFTSAGVFAAGYFNWVMYDKLQVICSWCEASHMIMITLFFVNAPWNFPKKITRFIAIFIIGGLLAGMSNAPTENGLGTCLAEKGFTFYGAYWCPHCNEQKDLIGSSVGAVYVECALQSGGQTEFCNAAGIEAYPTWEFPDGTRKTGLIPIDELKAESGC